MFFWSQKLQSNHILVNFLVISIKNSGQRKMRKILLFTLLYFSIEEIFPQSSGLKSLEDPMFIKYLMFNLESGPILNTLSGDGKVLVQNSKYYGLDLKLGFQKDSESTYSKLCRFPMVLSAYRYGLPFF